MAFSPCLEKSLSNAQITASLSLLREPRSRAGAGHRCEIGDCVNVEVEHVED